MSPFRNRILEYGVKSADQFLAHPKNARIHPEYQREVMKTALETIGYVAPVIESKSGYLLDGHERIFQALENNSDVPFVTVDIDESEEDYILATFDASAKLAVQDVDKTLQLISDVSNAYANLDFDWLNTDLETSKQLSEPKLHARRAARREFSTGLKREALTELIPALPPPDVDLYVIGNGAGAEIRHGINPLAFDFGTFIPHVVRMLGDKNCIAYVSSWTMSEIHVKSMIAMLDDGRLSRLVVFADPYFSRRTPAIYAQLATGLQRHYPHGQYLAFKNHVKCIALATSDESRTCVITGSANLSAQPRCEQYVLTTAPDVYTFFRDEFFEAMLRRE